MKQPARKPGRGRPTTLPPGAKHRSIRLTDAEWKKVKPFVRLGRPKAEVTKERITIRLSRDVVSTFRATGDGWQTRIDAALKQYIAEHPSFH